MTRARFAGMRISAVLHPTVLLALADGGHFLQHADPRSVRIAGGRSFVISIGVAPAQDESFGLVPVPAVNTGQGFPTKGLLASEERPLVADFVAKVFLG
jgi:hypothetical protein